MALLPRELIAPGPTPTGQPHTHFFLTQGEEAEVAAPGPPMGRWSPPPPYSGFPKWPGLCRPVSKVCFPACSFFWATKGSVDRHCVLFANTGARVHREGEGEAICSLLSHRPLLSPFHAAPHSLSLNMHTKIKKQLLIRARECE